MLLYILVLVFITMVFSTSFKLNLMAERDRLVWVRLSLHAPSHRRVGGWIPREHRRCGDWLFSVDLYRCASKVKFLGALRPHPWSSGL